MLQPAWHSFLLFNLICRIFVFTASMKVFVRSSKASEIKINSAFNTTQHVIQRLQPEIARTPAKLKGWCCSFFRFVIFKCAHVWESSKRHQIIWLLQCIRGGVALQGVSCMWEKQKIIDDRMTDSPTSWWKLADRRVVQWRPSLHWGSNRRRHVARRREKVGGN